MQMDTCSNFGHNAMLTTNFHYNRIRAVGLYTIQCQHKFQLQHYMDSRPLHNLMLTVNLYYNRIGMVDLYIMQCYM